jgi:hypothetical protein
VIWPNLDTLHDMLQKIRNNGVQRNVTTPGFRVAGSRLLTSPDLTGLVQPAEIRRAVFPVPILWQRDGGRQLGTAGQMVELGGAAQKAAAPPSLTSGRTSTCNSSDEELDIGGCCIVQERCCPCDVASFDEI